MLRARVQQAHDTQPVRELAASLIDKLYGDKGYLSKALEVDLACEELPNLVG